MKKLLLSIVILLSMSAAPNVSADTTFYPCTYTFNNQTTIFWNTQDSCTNSFKGTVDTNKAVTCTTGEIPSSGGVCGRTATTPGNGNLPAYEPLEPLPGFDQSGQTDFSTFLNSLFKIAIAAGAIIAVAMLVYSGIVYMVSGAIGTKSAALKRIQASLWGLLLLISSYLLLYTINPRLVGQNPDGTISATPTVQTAPVQNPSLSGGTSCNGGVLTTASTDTSSIQSFQNSCRTKQGSVVPASGGTFVCVGSDMYTQIPTACP